MSQREIDAGSALVPVAAARSVGQLRHGDIVLFGGPKGEFAAYLVLMHKFPANISSWRSRIARDWPRWNIVLRSLKDRNATNPDFTR